MEWNEFKQLQAGDRVMTTHWGEGTVKKWMTPEKLEVQLYRCKQPECARRCNHFTRTEIKSKL